VVHLAKFYSDEEHVNVGSGAEVTIKELAGLVCETVGFQGDLLFDVSKPDGTPRKLSDVSKLHGLGWNRARALRDGLGQTYQTSFDLGRSEQK